MERDALIEFLIKNVEAGVDVGIAEGYGIYSELTVSWVKATVRKKRTGPRYASTKAKTGLAVLHPIGRPPKF
jgi:hypothetical protein